VNRKPCLLIGGTVLVVAAGCFVFAQEARPQEATSARKGAAPPAPDHQAVDEASRQMPGNFLAALSKGDARPSGKARGHGCGGQVG
jgi:hypothetical protein